MSEQELERALFRALRRSIFLVLALYALLQFLESVTFLILLFSLVILLAAVLNPVVAWLERRRIPRPLSAITLGLVLLGAVAAALYFAVPPLLDQGQQFVQSVPELWDDLRARMGRFLSRHPEIGAQVPTSQELLQRLGPYVTRLAGQLSRYTLGAVGVLVTLVVLVVLVVYCLASPQPLVAGLLGAIPAQHRARAEQILGLLQARLKAWALGSLVLGLIVGVMTGVGLYVLKVPFALVFGVIAGMGELLPNIGPLLSAIPPILVSLAVDPTLAVWVAGLFLVVQQLENNLIVPLVMSRALDLHPVSVTFMVLVMGTLFGVVGAILAVPTTVVIKTLYQELYLAQRVNDPEALEAQSQRVVSEVAPPAATAPAASERGRENQE